MRGGLTSRRCGGVSRCHGSSSARALLKQWGQVVLFCEPLAGTMSEWRSSEQRKEETMICFQESSSLLIQGSQVTINDIPVLDLLALYPETLPDLMKPQEGTRRRPGTDEHLLAAMHKTLKSLGALREALRWHPQACSSDTWPLYQLIEDPTLIPPHTVSDLSRHGSPYHGTPHGL